MLEKSNWTQQQHDIRKFQEFLYLLMRDHLVSGVVHEIVKDLQKFPHEKVDYTNPFLAEDARTIAMCIVTSTSFCDAILQPADIVDWVQDPIEDVTTDKEIFPIETNEE